MTRSKRRLILKFNMISFFSAVSLLHYFLPSRKSISMFKKVFVSHAKAPRVDFSRRAGFSSTQDGREEKGCYKLVVHSIQSTYMYIYILDQHFTPHTLRVIVKS
ncbi:hypothetical protein RMP76_107 [Saccharomyces cerevisiae synthetic construct]|nr:Yhr049c-ap [Saccharomyces cerevisiae]WNM96966.1 hypothetical protein RMP76_107 [Saccharomyces cerevisiae synthetic construct]